MKKTVLAFLLLVMLIPVSAQVFVDLHKGFIIKHMKEDMRNFILDGSSKNEHFNYLKFVDRYGEETLLVFLSEKDFCTKTKLISDYSNMKERLKDINKQYTPVGTNKWKYEKNGKEYIIELKKEKWFFVIQTIKKE